MFINFNGLLTLLYRQVVEVVVVTSVVIEVGIKVVVEVVVVDIVVVEVRTVVVVELKVKSVVFKSKWMVVVKVAKIAVVSNDVVVYYNCFRWHVLNLKKLQITMFKLHNIYLK